MPLDYSNPHVLKFLTENFEKAEERRMIWFLKNQEKLEKLASFPENYTGIRTAQVQKIALELCLPALEAHNVSSAVYRRKKPLRDGVLQSVSQLKNRTRFKRSKLENSQNTLEEPSVVEPMMKPVDPEVHGILFDALSKGGRRQYLNKRKRALPEEKYNFCETSSSVVGWRLNDSGLCRQPSQHGRYFAFKRDLSSRSGPQPDPAYYQQPPKDSFSKCFG